MLRIMRKYARGWFIKIVFGAIIVVFVAFFGYGTHRPGDRVVGQAGRHKITFTEYQENYDGLVKLYRNLYREKFEAMVKELNLREQAMNQIINRYLLLQKAEELGLTVGEKEFTDYLGGMEAFKRQGRFDEKAYAEALKRTGIDPKQFEGSEKDSLVAEKLINLVRDNAMFLSDTDVWQAYVKEKGKVNLAYIQFDPAQFRNSVNVTDRELAEAYDKEKDRYRSESVYTLKYIALDENTPLKDSEVYSDLLKAKDLGTYAKEKGLEVHDLGRLKESEVLGRLKDLKGEQWLKGLKKGEVSLPVRGQSKSYIFQVIDREEGRPIEKSVVLKEIKERIINEKAKALARVSAGDAINAKTAVYKQETGYFPRSLAAIPKIGELPGEHAAVLTLSEQNRTYGKPVEINDKYYIFSFKGEELPDKVSWEREKDSYRKFLLSKEQDAYVKTFIDGLRKTEKVKVYWKEIL